MFSLRHSHLGSFASWPAFVSEKEGRGSKGERAVHNPQPGSVINAGYGHSLGLW